MKLYSYCIPIDDGAAPNPYWGVCTLTVCKPAIRRVAQVGDWIVGVGSVNVGGVDYSGRMVYAMKVTDVLTLKEYDQYCREKLPNKIPNLLSRTYARKVGDCLYHYSPSDVITQRDGVHEEGHMQTDLGGKHALLSKHFYYFGNSAPKIPPQFSVLIRQGRSHQAPKNESIKEKFVKWLTQKFDKNRIFGDPQIELLFVKNEGDKLCRSKKCNYKQKHSASLNKRSSVKC